MTALVDIRRVTDEIGDCDARTKRLLSQWIESASGSVERLANRPLSAGTYVDTVPSTRHATLVLAAAPLISVTTIECLTCGTSLDPADIVDTAANQAAGMAYRRGGWGCCVRSARHHFLTGEPLPGGEEPNLRVTYQAGYVTAPQAASRTSGFYGQPVTFPAELSDIIAQMVVGRWSTRGKPGNIASIKNLSASVSFTPGGADFPQPLVDRVLAYSLSCF